MRTFKALLAPLLVLVFLALLPGLAFAVDAAGSDGAAKGQATERTMAAPTPATATDPHTGMAAGKRRYQPMDMAVKGSGVPQNTAAPGALVIRKEVDKASP